MTNTGRTSFASAALLCCLLVSSCASGSAGTEQPAAQTPSVTPSASADTPTTTDTRDFIVDLDELAEMSPEQLTAVSTISVESVSVDGSIDWTLYADKYNDVRKLITNAGTGYEELNELYLAGEPLVQDVIRAKYNDAMLSGLMGQDSLRISDTNLRNYHNDVIIAAFNQYLLSDNVSVLADFEVASVEVLSQDDDSARIIVSTRYTDNFFSSGAFDPEDSRLTSNLGRAADLDVTRMEELTLKIEDGNIYVFDARNL